jgi:hypothetical protein
MSEMRIAGFYPPGRSTTTENCSGVDQTCIAAAPIKYCAALPGVTIAGTM